MKQGWDIKKLGEVADVTDYVANGSFATLRENVSYLNENGYAILVRLADYTNHFDKKKFVYIDEHAYKFLAKSKLFGGEIIMSNVGSIGKAFICPDLGMPMSLAPNSIVIKTPYNPFFYYLFQSDFFQTELKGISSQTALPKFNKTSFKKINIPVPPLAEQEKIVAELDCLSCIIEKKKQQLKEYDTLAQSIFYDMFGNPIDNEKGWEMKKLGEVCKIICGQDYKSVKDDNGKYPIYGTGGIMGYASQYRCPANSIIIGRKGNINNPLFVNCEFWNVDTAFGVVPNTFVLEPLFFFFFCKNYDFTKHDVSVTIPSLRRTDIIEINVPCPTLILQQEFASKIEAIEKQKELLKQSIAETETLFNSRMDYYFN